MLSLNVQPIEKPDYCEDGSLDVFRVFKTIQGEGPDAGTPAIFIRLAGCNLQCRGCDTDYTTRRERYSFVDLLALVREQAGNTAGLVVLTGGEPFRQNLSPLCWALLGAGFSVQIETNGTLPPSSDLPLSDDGGPSVGVVCSPKTPRVHPDLVRWVEAWKYVLSAWAVDPHDGLPTDVLGTGLRPVRPSFGVIDGKQVLPTDIFVQPADEGNPELNAINRDAAVQSCLAYGYRLSLQTHKLLGLE